MYRVIIGWIRNNFGFSRTEANAYAVLIALLMGLHFWPDRFSIFSTNEEHPIYLDSLTSLLYPVAARDSTRLTNETLIKPVDTTNQQLDQPPATDNTSPRTYKNQSIEPMDLNRVDSIWLMKIYGIGPILSQRIIKYRNLLGGFHSLEQLKEVYHLPEEVIGTLKQHVFIDLSGTPVEKISLDTLDFMQIASHPYISFNLARVIVSFREQHGPFNSPEDLKKIHLMDDSTYLRVRPYLDF